VVRRTTSISSLALVKAIRHFGSAPSALLICAQLVVLIIEVTVPPQDHLE